MLPTRRPGHRALNRLRILGGGLRSWLGVRSTCTPAHRPPGGHSSDTGIRGPLHPLRLRCSPSPYRSGYASVGRLAGSGASTLSMHGLFRNGPLEAGLTAPPSCDCCALYREPGAMRGSSTKRPVERGILIPTSGTGSERAQGRERSGVESLREPGSPHRNQPPRKESRWECAPLRGRHIRFHRPGGYRHER